MIKIESSTNFESTTPNDSDNSDDVIFVGTSNVSGAFTGAIQHQRHETIVSQNDNFATPEKRKDLLQASTKHHIPPMKQEGGQQQQQQQQQKQQILDESSLVKI
eukprot:7306520-Ditylum_brightwellii.AAC.1